MRNTGQTTAMVRALPVNGCIVVVHTGAMGHHLRAVIEDLRGAAVAATIRIVCATSAGEVRNGLIGTNRPVFVDHAVWEHANLAAREAVSYYARAANARHPEMDHLDKVA